MAMTAWAVVSGLVLARLVARLPYYRSWIVIGVVVAMVVPWTAVLLWPGVAPDWLVVVMAFATASGGPAAMVGFDLARSFTPAARDRPRQRPGQRRRLHRLAAHDGADRGRARPVRRPAAWTPTRSATSSSRWRCSTLFWALGVVQILRYRRRGLAHLARVHPGSVEQMRAGPAVRAPGDRHRGRLSAGATTSALRYFLRSPLRPRAGPWGCSRGPGRWPGRTGAAVSSGGADGRLRRPSAGPASAARPAVPAGFALYSDSLDQLRRRPGGSACPSRVARHLGGLGSPVLVRAAPRHWRRPRVVDACTPS